MIYNLNLTPPALEHLSTNFSTLPSSSKLLQFSFSYGNLYTLWLSREDESTIVQTLNTGGRGPRTNGWLTFNETQHLPNELEIPDIKDIQETYLNYICNTRYMRVQCIIKALHLFDHTPPAILTHASVINGILVCAMGSSDGSVFGVRFPTRRDQPFSSFELKQTGIMSRFISGFIRKSESNTQENILSSMQILNFQDRQFILQIFRDCKLKLLHLERNECILSEDLSSHLHNQVGVCSIEPTIELDQATSSGVQKLAILISTSTLAVFLTYDLHLNLTPPALEHLSTNFSTLPSSSKLLQFSFSYGNLYTLWLSREDESTIVQTLNTRGRVTKWCISFSIAWIIAVFNEA